MKTFIATSEACCDYRMGDGLFGNQVICRSFVHDTLGIPFDVKRIRISYSTRPFPGSTKISKVRGRYAVSLDGCDERRAAYAFVIAELRKAKKPLHFRIQPAE